MRRLDDIAGKRFENVVVLGHHSQARASNGAAFHKWNCKCDCGFEFVARGEYIKYGICGEICPECKRTAKAKKDLQRMQVKRIWRGIIRRCESQSGRSYPRYSGRGIRICKRWRQSMYDFAQDMGARPSLRHSIDRKDNDGHYSCGKCDECVENGWNENCRWATPQEQILNSTHPRFVEHCGESLCLAEWARRLGISREAMRMRVNRVIAKGKPASYAITMTPSPGARIRKV